MSIKHPVGLLLTGRPDRNVRIRAGSDDATILQKCDSVHRTVVKAHHLLGDVAASDQRIADVSKLPETACAPSGEIASARTGPP